MLPQRLALAGHHLARQRLVKQLRLSYATHQHSLTGELVSAAQAAGVERDSEHLFVVVEALALALPGYRERWLAKAELLGKGPSMLVCPDVDSELDEKAVRDAGFRVVLLKHPDDDADVCVVVAPDLVCDIAGKRITDLLVELEQATQEGQPLWADRTVNRKAEAASASS